MDDGFPHRRIQCLSFLCTFMSDAIWQTATQQAKKEKELQIISVKVQPLPLPQDNEIGGITFGATLFYIRRLILLIFLIKVQHCSVISVLRAGLSQLQANATASCYSAVICHLSS